MVIRPDARLEVAALKDLNLLIHPEHRPALAEISKVTHVTSEAFVMDRDRLTALFRRAISVNATARILVTGLREKRGW